MTLNPCPVCSSPSIEDLSPYRGHSALFRACRLVTCTGCSLVFASPIPLDTELEAYNRSYFDHAHGGQPSDAETLAFLSGIAKIRRRHIEAYLDSVEGRELSVLEIGPGQGFLCQQIMIRWLISDYLAVETDHGCHPSLEKLGAHVVEQLNQLDLSQARFDLLILSHVLEHTSDPRAFLKPAIDALKPGGAVFIEVPCRDHEHKPDYEPHLLFFDKPSMESLLRGLGLGDLQLTYHGQLLGSIQDQHTIMARIQRSLRRLASPFIHRLGLVPRIEGVDDPAERAAVAPYEAHLSRDQPAWWLRAMAHKPRN